MAYPLTFEEYQQGLRQGRFPGVKCTACGAVSFPPKAVCQECGKSDMQPMDLSGKGVIRTFTVIRVAPLYYKPPYIVAKVETQEGPHVVGNLIGLDPDEAGMDLVGKPVTFGQQAAPPEASLFEDLRVLTFELAS
jgi:uncharacterized OB-fold protein